MLLLVAALRRKLGRVGMASIALSSLRTFVAALAAGAAAWGASTLAGSARQGTLPAHRAIAGCIAALVFATVFSVTAWGVRSPELDGLISGMKRRLRRA
jgi:hypothetical protein